MKLLFLFSLLLPSNIFFNSDEDNTQIFKRLNNLQGTWEMKTSKGSLYESWKRINDTLFQGGSYKIKGDDTIFLENVSLKLQSDGIFYVPVVKENSSAPVSFKL